MLGIPLEPGKRFLVVPSLGDSAKRERRTKRRRRELESLASEQTVERDGASPAF